MSVTFELSLLGGTGLGVAIAFLVAFFLQHFTVFNERVLGVVVSVIAGGSLTYFLRGAGGDSVAAWSGYCLGLGVTFGGIMFLGKRVGARLSSEPAAGASSGQDGSAGTGDSRLNMLRELQRMHESGAIEPWEWKNAREKVIESIQANPHMNGG